MKAFFRGLLFGLIGSVLVLALGLGICYFSGLLDFVGAKEEALSSAVKSAGAETADGHGRSNQEGWCGNG